MIFLQACAEFIVIGVLSGLFLVSFDIYYRSSYTNKHSQRNRMYGYCVPQYT